jgi:LmbE family N-acetylglucosaminyl deacetylase
VSFERTILPYAPAALEPARVLVLAPHPDDEALGCGGAIALHRARGDAVEVAFVTAGERGDWAGEGSAAALVERREAEAGRALAVLGVDAWQSWRLADRGVVADDALVRRIAAAIDAFEATLVYAPSPLEPHPDHRAVADALRAAVRGRDLRIAWTEVGWPLPPNTLVDVSAVWERKQAAIRCYASQLAGYDYLGRIEGLGRYRGLTLGDAAEVVEAFRVTPASELDGDPIWRWRDLQTASPASPAAAAIAVERTDPTPVRTAIEHRARDAESRAEALSRESGRERALREVAETRAEELERALGDARAEISRLNHEVASRESLIEAMRSTRLWRLAEAFRRFARRG